MGYAIYKPKGKAGEYAEWACNLYVGCSNNCSYCYCKRGVLGHAMGMPEAKLKKCFKDEVHAEGVFTQEVKRNLEDLRASSLFFTFSSDPMIPSTRDLNIRCIDIAVSLGIKCQVLTKNADFIYYPGMKKILVDIDGKYRKHVAFGFSLTGCDGQEPGASKNMWRCDAMGRLKLMGFRTFASLEPVVEPLASLHMFKVVEDRCDVFKVGLQSGRSIGSYDRNEVKKMADGMLASGRPVYFKKSLTDYLGLNPQEPLDVFAVKE